MTSLVVKVKDANGAYTTTTVRGKRASSTSSARDAASRLAEKLWGTRAVCAGPNLGGGVSTWRIAPNYGELNGVAEAPPSNVTEVLTWNDAANTWPDSDLTVLCWNGEEFFCGYWDDSLPGWIGCESGGSVLGVTHWSQPNGPAPTR